MTPPDAVLRIIDTGHAHFQLRAGEEGLSVFDATLITEDELLQNFRPGSRTVTRSWQEIRSLGLDIIRTPGDPIKLSPQAQAAHCEIVPGPGMTRNEFKRALRLLADAGGQTNE